MIFTAKLINGIRNGTVTKTVRPVLSQHPRGGPWRVGQNLPVKTSGSRDELLRIEVQDVERIAVGDLDLRDLRAAGFKYRDSFLEHWMTTTASKSPPKNSRMVWLVTFRTYSSAWFLAALQPHETLIQVEDEHGYTRNPRNAIDVDEHGSALEALSQDDLSGLTADAHEQWRKSRGAELTQRELDSIYSRLRRLRDDSAAKCIDLHSDVSRLSAQISALERQVRSA